VASLSQGRTAAAQCGLFTHKSVPVIFEPPCISSNNVKHPVTKNSGPVISTASEHACVRHSLYKLLIVFNIINSTEY